MKWLVGISSALEDGSMFLWVVWWIALVVKKKLVYDGWCLDVWMGRRMNVIGVEYKLQKCTDTP
jgi:hypothetical protein